MAAVALPTVLIVDDHADFRALARTLLEAGGLDVVGEAADGTSALEAVRTVRSVHVLLSFPSGALSRRLSIAAVALVYVDGAIEPVARSATVTIVLSVIVAAAAIGGYARETGVRRRARATSTLGAVAVAAVLVIDLGGLSEPFTLRDRVARALGDPSLEVGYRLVDEAGYADDAGRPVLPPAPESDRAVTPIERDGEQVAILVHDPAVLQEPALIDAVAAATRIAVTNAGLQAQVRASVADVAASRRRIVEAADAQRRRLARELQDGAQRRWRRWPSTSRRWPPPARRRRWPTHSTTSRRPGPSSTSSRAGSVRRR
jgi:hypothetical protein